VAVPGEDQYPSRSRQNAATLGAATAIGASHLGGTSSRPGNQAASCRSVRGAAERICPPRRCSPATRGADVYQGSSGGMTPGGRDRCRRSKEGPRGDPTAAMGRPGPSGPVWTTQSRFVFGDLTAARKPATDASRIKWRGRKGLAWPAATKAEPPPRDRVLPAPLHLRGGSTSTPADLRRSGPRRGVPCCRADSADTARSASPSPISNTTPQERNHVCLKDQEAHPPKPSKSPIKYVPVPKPKKK
jgi:hypothetical protein